MAEPYIRRRARRHLEKGRIVILAAGTGSPFVTTDTAAAQRALELEADILLKATRVDGVFCDDPEKNPHAVLYRELSYVAVREQNLRVMDPTAIAQCMEHDMPILVFNFKKEGNIERAVNGERVGTLISQGQGLWRGLGQNDRSRESTELKSLKPQWNTKRTRVFVT